MNTLPLFIHTANQIVSWRNSRAISALEFLRDVMNAADQLPAYGYAINLCEDRYHFLVSFAAVIVKGQTNLLPSNHAPHTINEVSDLYPDCYCLTDNATILQGMDKQLLDKRVTLQFNNDDSVPNDLAYAESFIVPHIETTHPAAIAFTSGSTGKPAANLKSWGQLVQGTQRIQEGITGHSRLPVNILATVPAQHMYGLENSIMLPLVSGSSIHAGRPLFPQDISEALSAMPEPRLLVTTPVHLKSCIGSGISLPALALVISATAPLDTALAEATETAFHTRVLEIYGCTECGSLAMRQTTQDSDWQLLNGFTISCAEIGGEQACKVTAPHLAEQIQLHDHIELTAHDRFHLRGRKADMINIAGKRASLADLNIKLNQIEGVNDGIILLPENETDNVTRLLAIVCAPELSEQQIINALKTRFDPAFMPRPIYKVDKLPREATGKLLRSNIYKLLDELRGAINQSAGQRVEQSVEKGVEQGAGKNVECDSHINSIDSSA